MDDGPTRQSTSTVVPPKGRLAGEYNILRHVQEIFYCLLQQIDPPSLEVSRIFSAVLSKMMSSTRQQVVGVLSFLILLVPAFLSTSVFSFTLSPNTVRDGIRPSKRHTLSRSRRLPMWQGHNMNLSHHLHKPCSGMTKLSAAVGGGDNGSGNSKGPILPFALPSLSQILSIWIVAISANRVYQSLSLAQNASSSNDMMANLALNGVLLLGASFYLLKSIQGIDYSTLEGLDKLSLANQVGEWALAGIVPTTLTIDDKTYEVATFAGGCFWYV